MVVVAPLPADFPPPSEVTPELAEAASRATGFDANEVAPTPATVPPSPAAYLEALGRESGPEDRVRRMLPGGGHIDASATALRRLEEDFARVRAMPPVKHASQLAAEAREREEQAEADRKARANPRIVLRVSHRLHAESIAEVERLAPMVDRARHLVDDIEQRQHQHAEAVAVGDRAAADALIAALSSGAEAPPAVSLTAPDATLAAELRAAKAALEQLRLQAIAARDLLQKRHNGIARCAREVLVAEAVEAAYEITAADEELNARRADLAALTVLLTSEGRRLNGPGSPSLPAMISRALYPADRTLTRADRGMAQTDWAAHYRALCEDDPEVPPGLRADGGEHL